MKSLLVERHPGTALVPKAHIIHCRTLEILGQVDLEDEVRRQGCPPENFTHTSWYTSLSGDEAWDQQLVASIPSWSYSTLAPYYATLTASPMTNLAQHLLEPVLRQRAEELNGTEMVRFHHEMISLVQDESGVVASILDRDSGQVSQVRAQYVVGADGGKSVGRSLGVPMLGPEPFVDVVSLTFDADFSEYLQEDYSLIRLFSAAQSGWHGASVQHCGQRAGAVGSPLPPLAQRSDSSGRVRARARQVHDRRRRSRSP